MNNENVKRNNMLKILRVIYDNNSITKPDIAEKCNLTSVTAHNYIETLVKKDIVMEDGNAKSNGGRKAILYRINSDYGYIIGQNIGTNYICTNIFDVNCKLLYTNKLVCSLTYSEKVVNLLLQEIEIAIENMKCKREDFIGIGISVPGQVDHQNGVIKNLTNVSGWKRIPIKNIVEKSIGIKTFVDNDNNAFALAAKWLNIVSNNTYAVTLSISSGVGVGILNKGKLLYGSNSNAGELGHTTIKYDGPLCNCGNRGCIEVMISDNTIIQKTKESLELKDNEKVDIDDVIRLAKEDNEKVVKILKETCDFISIAVEHIVKIYDPEVAIIQSKWLNEFPNLYYSIIDNVLAKCSWINPEGFDIMLNPIDDIMNISTCALVLEHIFTNKTENPIFEKLDI